MPHEEIVFALDAIQDPVSLFEPIYNDGGDPIYVMDQISDERNKDTQWIEELALKEGMRRLNEREKMILRKRFSKGKPKWKSLKKSAYPKLRSQGLKKRPLNK